MREFSIRFFLGPRPAQCFSHSDVPWLKESAASTEIPLLGRVFGGVYVCLVVWGGCGTCPKGGKIYFERKKPRGSVTLV